MQIYPSILEENLEKFTTQFTKLSPYFDHFQIDIADGEFVENRTVHIEELVWGFGGVGDGGKEMGSVGVWETENKTFEFHLMVKDYQADIERIESFNKSLSIKLILVHLGPYLNASRILESSIPSGIVLNPEDAVPDNWEYISGFQTIQLMTVNPGFQGNPFLPEVLEKITQLREYGFTGQIILDGGINDESLPIILKNKYLPDAVCPGSYLHEDTEGSLAKLKFLLNS